MTRSILFISCVSLVALAGAQSASLGSAVARTPISEFGASFLMFPSVQKELGLSASASKQISDNYQKSVKAMMASAGAQAKVDPKTVRSQMAARMADMRKMQTQNLNMLSPKQKARLREITLQQMGAGALLHPEVKKALAITPDEERKVTAIVRDGQMQMMASYRSSASGGKPGAMQTNFAEMQKKRDEWQVKMNAMASKELTAGQNAKWHAMLGKPFKLDVLGGMRAMAPRKAG
jgi:hypothetical protein